MSKTLQIDDLLVSLSHEGQRDSSGAFTVDIAKSEEKMRAFQLADPYHYCLRWLQAAVTGGGKRFLWQSTPLGARLEIAGFQLDPEGIARLPAMLFESQASQAERHLSAGINAVIQTQARELRVSSGRLQASWTPGKYQEQKLEPAVKGIVIELKRSPGNILKELWFAAKYHDLGSSLGSKKARDNEERLLHAHGACAPLTVGIHGLAPDWRLPYREPATGWGRLAGMFLRLSPSDAPATPFSSEMWLAPGPGQKRFQPLQQRYAEHCQGQIPKTCRVYVGRPKEYFPCSFLYPIKDGVTLARLEILEDSPGCVFLVEASQLTTDLSGLKIVQDEAFQALCEELRTLTNY